MGTEYESANLIADGVWAAILEHHTDGNGRALNARMLGLAKRAAEALGNYRLAVNEAHAEQLAADLSRVQRISYCTSSDMLIVIDDVRGAA